MFPNATNEDAWVVTESLSVESVSAKITADYVVEYASTELH